MLDFLLILLFGGAAFYAVHRATDQFTRWAPQVLLDVPNERSSHERPTLRGGGLAIVLAVVVGAA
ncbi:MAG TPA: hypothetical protein VK933_10090, partial [Longimicrobiales bacterium]|nr:hypothetical protein [Longimicrobiales bacterium]HSJ31775.1 hypothetical protein [Longimicrobiales bacterium]